METTQIKTIEVIEGTLLHSKDNRNYLVDVEFILDLGIEESYFVTVTGFQGSPKVHIKGFDIEYLYGVLEVLGVLKAISYGSLGCLVRHDQL
jgi:hypothetical protein